MNPDEKYMSQVNLDNADIKFVPLQLLIKVFVMMLILMLIIIII